MTGRSQLSKGPRGPYAAPLLNGELKKKYHIRINKRRVALKKQTFSKPHENDAKISSRETALIAPRRV